jgi:DNA-binding NarL/FixJ family response regulator
MAQPKFLVAVDRRQFNRGCLTSWLNTLGQEFQVTGVADVEKSLQADELERASAVILSTSAPLVSDSWLQDQIAWLRAGRVDAPIVVIAESDRLRTAEMLIARLHLRGYIPISSTMEVAAAALHLVIGGGTYVPRMRDGDRHPAQNAVWRMPEGTDCPR